VGTGTVVTVPISVGELFDKISILEIKSRRITDVAKQVHVERELLALRGVADASVALDMAGYRVLEDLRLVNLLLWEIEDRIRECERSGDFGADFVALARGVYMQNDRRAALKRRLNELTASEIVEEKSYAGAI